jgi:hypothetical protein
VKEYNISLRVDFMYVRPLADPARLMIRVDQVEAANQILNDIKLSFMGIKLDKQNYDH